MFSEGNNFECGMISDDRTRQDYLDLNTQPPTKSDLEQMLLEAQSLRVVEEVVAPKQHQDTAPSHVPMKGRQSEHQQSTVSVTLPPTKTTPLPRLMPFGHSLLFVNLLSQILSSSPVRDLLLDSQNKFYSTQNISVPRRTVCHPVSRAILAMAAEIVLARGYCQGFSGAKELNPCLTTAAVTTQLKTQLFQNAFSKPLDRTDFPPLKPHSTIATH